MVKSIVWFRRDLRLSDHPGLAAALAEGETMALFVDDPAFASHGAARRALLHDCVAALRHAMGGALVVRRGDPASVVPAVADEVDAAAVFVSKDFGPYGRRRDASVAEALRADGRSLRGVGSPYAVDPGTVVKDDGSPYAVFTPFSRRWRDVGWAAPIVAPRSAAWLEARSAGATGGGARHPRFERGRRARSLAPVP
jgi:deoxyribodipyrimidine photo-lyase